MDSRIRNLAVFLGISLLALVLGMVFYVNKKDTPAAADAENEVQDMAYGEQLTETELHAFMQDETFFDATGPGKAESASANTIPRLYLLVSSVQHDIRAFILDEKGNIVTGHPFYLKVDDTDYKDLDQDGCIYVPDLRAGDYFVSLAPVDGYEVPEDPVHVSVKDSLEYKVLTDISYLIVTEDEINALEEDTENQIAGEDTDETENTGILLSQDSFFGIDVSKWQKEIDWDKVAACGVKFAIIRCGYRGSSSGCLVEDPYFIQNIEGAQKAGIKVGVYFFTQAVSTVEAVEEASMVAALCKDYELDYPVFIDTESAGGNGRADQLDKAARTDICEAFCRTIETEGYQAGIYASRSWYYNQLENDRIQDYVLWDAEYRSEPIYTGNFKIWQYTSNGYLDGINTRVDLNISYVDFQRNAESGSSNKAIK